MSVSFTIPGTPRAWSRARHDGRSGRFFTSDALRFFQDETRLRARAAMAGREPFSGPVALSVRVLLPVAASWSGKKRAAAVDGWTLPTARPDLDNFCKGVADALNGIVFKDDAQATDLLAVKRYAVTPCIEVRVRPIETRAIDIAAEHVAHELASGGSLRLIAEALGRCPPPGVELAPATLAAWVAEAWLSLGSNAVIPVTSVTRTEP